MAHYVDFNTAKVLKEKGFDEECNNFYTKPNSKMFGRSEKGRYYPIQNTSRKLYTVGEHATLNNKNIYYAPEQCQIIDWLLEKHGIWIVVNIDIEDNWYFEIYDVRSKRNTEISTPNNTYNNPKEAYTASFDYILTNLI